MSGETVTGGEGAPGFLDRMFDLVGLGAGIYGSVEGLKAQTESDRLTATTAAQMAQFEAQRTDTRWKWIALAGVGLLATLVLFKKGKVI